MWLLLKENLSKKFKNDCNYTYLFPINKNNFFIGKNNSGKSYFNRFLMKNTIKIYIEKEELIKDIAENILNVPMDIIAFAGLKNEMINNYVARFLKYEELLKKIDNSKKETGRSTIIGFGAANEIKHYSYENSSDLFEEIKPLLDFLNLEGENISSILDSHVVHKKSEIENKISSEFRDGFINELNDIPEEQIYELGDLLTRLEFLKNRSNETQKYYIPVMRSIRHPQKNVTVTEEKDDIYKTRSILEYHLDEKEITIITGLEFYRNYKKDLLGSKEKREKINQFEKFLSQYFFDGENIAIIPDEETFELKININNEEEDRFIYEVGEGISSLLIIAYTLFTEADENNKLFFIEEPEISFHPGFQRLLINIITYYEKFKNCIFFFSTHSNHLIDIGVNEIKNSNLILCKKDQKNDISIKIQEETYNEILEELGVQASSVRIANKVIWIEGKYDALYIRLLLNLKNNYNGKYDENNKKYIEDYDYCFVPYSGANMELIKFDLEQDIDENEEFIVKANIINGNYMIILDDDNMSDDTNSSKFLRYNALKEKLGDKIYKLEVREIENLFPKEVLQSFIYNGMKDKSKLESLTIDYEEYKNQKLGDYINQNILNVYNQVDLKTITGRKDGFISNGFLYSKQKFYNEVLKWSKKEGFDYEKDVTKEAKKLINKIENFIKE